MNNLKYFIQFIVITFLFIIFKLLGLKYSTLLSGNIFSLFGPLFRSSLLTDRNLTRAFPKLDIKQRKKIFKKMWFNYGKIFAEYMFIKKFRNQLNFKEDIIIENPEYLNQIKKSSKPVVFISGHFDNFELMAMCIEKSGINLAAIYRPLNNRYLNLIMEFIRKNYICKNQIKKGISGTKELLRYFKSGTSIALMIDQRVSEGISCDFFGEKALTTTIPAQFVKKYKANIVPIHVERIEKNKFKLSIHKQLNFSENETIETITLRLNKFLEDMIIKNPDQWIWTHNRWK